LIERRGGAVKFVQSLDDHFDGGHNDHSNEVTFLLSIPIEVLIEAHVSHRITYLTSIPSQAPPSRLRRKFGRFR
jgi:hypothetical protein